MPDNLLEPDYKDAWDAWNLKKRDSGATGAFLKQIQPAIDKAMTINLGKPSPLLKGQAKLMTIKAIKTYDPSRASLTTHLTNQLQGLKRIAVRRPQAIPVPERWMAGRGHVEEAAATLEDELGRPPTLEEVADRTKLSIGKIQQLRGLLPTASGSVLGQEGVDYLPIQIPGQQEGPSVLHEIIYGDLDPINQKILEWSVGLHGQPVLGTTDIATKLRLSPGAISQRKAVIQRLMDRASQNSPF